MAGGEDGGLASGGFAGDEMYGWARDLFPMARSITGPGVRQTLDYLRGLLPGLQVGAVPSGTPVYDWTVPDEWLIRDAYLEDEAGRRIVDFRTSNLHVVGYSQAVDAWLELDALQPHLYSLPDQPDATPYITSYYAPTWGFCLPHRLRESLPDGRYHAVIDAENRAGVLNYGELILPGQTSHEVLLSTNICHPSLANNELSGPVVLTALARWLSTLESRRHTYRILFVPETIGAIAYLSRHAAQMKASTIAGFVLTCMGDDRAYSYVPSRLGDTLADRVALHVLASRVGSYRRYTYLDRGGDERQYCSPGIDLPVCSVMRTRYGSYPEYHTSLDDLSLISPAGLSGSLEVMRACLQVLEANRTWTVSVACEPQMGRRGLYPTLSRGPEPSAIELLNVLAYADGTRDLVGLAESAGVDALRCAGMLDVLAANGLVTAAPDQ